MSNKFEIPHDLKDQLADARTVEQRDRVALKLQAKILDGSLRSKGPGLMSRFMGTKTGKVLTYGSLAALTLPVVGPAALAGLGTAGAATLAAMPFGLKAGLVGTALAAPIVKGGINGVSRFLHSFSDRKLLKRVKRQSLEYDRGERTARAKKRPDNSEEEDDLPVVKTKKKSVSSKRPKPTSDIPEIEMDFPVAKPQPQTIPVAKLIEEDEPATFTPVTTTTNSPFSAQSFGPGPVVPPRVKTNQNAPNGSSIP